MGRADIKEKWKRRKTKWEERSGAQKIITLSVKSYLDSWRQLPGIGGFATTRGHNLRSGTNKSCWGGSTLKWKVTKFMEIFISLSIAVRSAFSFVHSDSFPSFPYSLFLDLPSTSFSFLVAISPSPLTSLLSLTHSLPHPIALSREYNLVVLLILL